jgi:hypothetical protein
MQAGRRNKKSNKKEFIKMCFNLGLKCISVVARTMHALLSSNTLNGGNDGN